MQTMLLHPILMMVHIILDSGSIYGGFLSSYTDFTGSAKTEEDFIKRYRSNVTFSRS